MRQREFIATQVRELKADLCVLRTMLKNCDAVADRNNEAGEGSCHLTAVAVLLERAIACYEQHMAQARIPIPTARRRKIQKAEKEQRLGTRDS